MVDTENKTYWIIDILPQQVPSDSALRYFEVERYFRSRLDEIIRKFAFLLVKLSCYRELEVCRDCETFSGDFAPGDLERFLLETDASPYPLYIRAGSPDTLFAYAGDEHYLTLYEPDQELLGQVRQIAPSEGLFVWGPMRS
ncbi:MAG: hypothetical protein II855_04770 [Candidatus Methanomethylophilaceae archaeon]|nr:hypothetical protein [Candidatus Methanomethylophilaceae archaeon]